jgi:hypothetical protein
MKTPLTPFVPVFDSSGPAGSLDLLFAVGGHCPWCGPPDVKERSAWLERSVASPLTGMCPPTDP